MKDGGREGRSLWLLVPMTVTPMPPCAARSQQTRIGDSPPVLPSGSMSAMVLTVRPLVAHSVHVRAGRHAHTYTDIIYAYKQAQTPTRTHSVIFTILCCCICYSTMCLFIISLSAVVDIKFCVLLETILHCRAYKATHFPNSLKLLALYPYRKACRRRCDTRPSRSRCRCRGR